MKVIDLDATIRCEQQGVKCKTRCNQGCKAVRNV